MKVNRILVLLLFIIFAVIIFLLPFKYLLHYSVDDSYFYIKTANNFANGLGSTFDTINKTNGYHPLWFLILVIYYFILNSFGFSSPEIVYRFTFLLAILLNFGSIYFLIKFYNNTFGEKYFSIFLFITPLLISFSLFHIIGLESQLLILLVSFYIYYSSKKSTSPMKENFIKGLILGLIMLTRLDMLFIIFPFLLVYELQTNRKKILFNNHKILFPFIILPLIFYAGFEIINYVNFSSLQTISSKILFKPNQFLLFKNIPNLLDLPINFVLLSINISAGILYYTYVKQNLLTFSKTSKFRIIEYLYWSGNLFLLIHFCFNIGGVRLWYYAYPNLISLILISPIIFYNNFLKKFLISFSFFVLLLFITLFRINYYNSDDAYNYARKIKEVVNKNENIYQVDYSGIIGFYSERNIINGDGLINSFEYYNYLLNNEINDYFKKVEIYYYSTFSYENSVDGIYFLDKLFHPGNFTFKFPKEQIVLKERKIHGGIFRKKYGWFYLFKLDEKLKVFPRLHY